MTGSVGGDGYRLRPAEVSGLIRRYESALERAIDYRERIGTITASTSAAGDPASELSNTAIAATGDALWRQNEANIAYATDWLNRLRAVQRDYQQVEQANQDLLRRSDPR